LLLLKVVSRRLPPDDLQQLVAARLAVLRKRQGLTQDDAAQRLGIALRNYQRMESGRQNLTLQTIEKVARALGVPAHDVLAIPQDRVSSTLHIVPAHDDDAPHAVPVFDLDAAAGYARSGRTAGALGWTLLPTPAPDERCFVAQVTGASMEPLIPSGSWCLFCAVDAVHDGQVALFELGGRARPDDGGSYVVKRLRRDHDRTALHSVNRTFAPVPVDEDVRVVARWVGVVAAS
jgi:transcriptional regulator with XRE-family HTH domain